MIDVQRLRVLKHVAEHGSFSKAAAALLLTPSAVSQQISALERSLGTAVVERGARGTRLTEPGRMLVETADVIIAELTSTQERIGRLTNGLVDRLTVATFASGGQRLLPAALQRFSAKHPGVEFDVFEFDPQDSIPLVRQGKADLALAYHFDGPPPVKNTENLEWTPIMDDPMWIVLPRHHRLADRTQIALSELKNERWVQGCLKINEILESYARLAGIEIHVSCNTTDYTFAQALIAAGVGIGLVPEVALVPGKDLATLVPGKDLATLVPGKDLATLVPGKDLVAIPLQQPHPSRFIGVVTRKRRPHPLIKDLLEAIAER